MLFRSTNTGLAVALADKLETLVGIWSIGLQPTGEKDPFALRRHALGVMRMLVEKRLPLAISELLKDAAGVFDTMASFKDPSAEVGAFMLDRLRGMLRVDPTTWEPEFFIPSYEVPGRARVHAMAWDNGVIWQVIGNDSKGYAENGAGLAKYDAATGALLETAEFLPGSCDPHGLAMKDGVLYSCDAGIHPNWPLNDSPTHGYIFRIDFA